MNYKLVASDFDDTLLRSDNTVSEHTLEVIRDFEARGGAFLIVTGRMMPSILKQMKRFGLEGLVVGYAGALIFDTQSGKNVYESPVANADAIEIVEELEALGLQVQIYVGEDLLVAHVNPYTETYAKACDVVPKELGVKLSDWLKETKISPYKVLAFAEPDVVRQQLVHINGEHENLYACYSKPYFIEIMARGTNKARAIEIIAERRGIAISETIAVGDSNNDVPMIRFAGLGAAVGNACDEAKVAADVVVAANDGDGVAELIEKYTK